MMRLFHRVRRGGKAILDDIKFDKNEMRKGFCYAGDIEKESYIIDMKRTV